MSTRVKVAIIGSRGIPNKYSGFEQFAERLSVGLVKNGYETFVYNSHNHPNQNMKWQGVNILHQYDPEYLLGTFGQFIYDFNCIVDSRKRGFDIILQLGYTSSSVWGWLLPKKSHVVTNMDGLEWKRAKYSYVVRKFLKFAEYLAVKSSNHLIADSMVIKEYLKKYNADVSFLSYGADIFSQPDPENLKKFNLSPYRYSMLVSRMVPENNIEAILNGFVLSASKDPIIVIGNQQNNFGRYIARKFNHPNIHFMGSIFDIDVLNNLRHYSNIYFHGHSVGGTNPSLLEAMASQALICAHDNVFNRDVLGENAFYFANEQDIAKVLDSVMKDPKDAKIHSNLTRVKQEYSWEKVIEDYCAFFKETIDQNGPRELLIKQKNIK